ncbi:hypothetical protein JKF63_02586 [Porcisia hertigi]|uniref:Formyl transferase N-terminal domain-containing protein n=1 Tax=Porcisia hertigi TaxID=2761500 RepID=A0A836IIV9_9TRYP|nr:hypothetical protein JKF63_02586 [Porcisia hertigi]
MSAVASSIMPIHLGTVTLQTGCGCGSGSRFFFRAQRSGLAVACGGKFRAYTAIPLSHLGVPVESRTNTQIRIADVDANSSSLNAGRETGAAPFAAAAAMSSSTQTSIVERPRVRGASRPVSQPACVRVPRLLVFGGDVVSVTALEALHTRMHCIVANALRSWKVNNSSGDTSGAQWLSTAAAASLQGPGVKADTPHDHEAMDDIVRAFVRDHITVVCPALPHGMTPVEAAKTFTRQYPLARYCVEHGLSIIPVDDPKSLSRSVLFKEMLDSVKKTAPSATGQQTHHVPKSTSLFSHLPPRGMSSAMSCCRAGAASPSANGQRWLGGSSPSPGSPATPYTWLALGRPLTDYDLTVVVSFRYFLPKRLLHVLPPVINMHPSLLPRYRGASPIFSALRSNEAVGGVSIIQMKPEQTAMDSGSVLWQCEVPISPDMDIRLYFPLVTQIGAAGLCDLIFGEVPPGWRPSVATGSACELTPSSNSAWMPSSTLYSGSCNQADAHKDGDHHRFTKGTTTVDDTAPSWFALRQRCLEPLVHRPGHHVAVPEVNSLCDRRSPVQTPLSVTERIRQTMSTSDGTAPSDCVKSPEKASKTESTQVCHRCRFHPWTTLCRTSTQITPEAVQAVNKKFRALFCQNLESSSTSPGAAAATVVKAAAVAASASPDCSAAVYEQRGCAPGAAALQRKSSPARKKTVSPTTVTKRGVTTTVRCAEVFPASVLSPHCDWPDSFTYSWRFAQVQLYRTYAHFSEDPYHAPLLSKDAAVVRFSSMDATEAFGVWRAFVGGEYFHPSVNATLDKGSTPVRNQLVRRAVRRLLLKRARAHAAPQKVTQQRRACAGTGSKAALTSAMASAADGSAVPVGIVSGDHVDLDVCSPADLQILTEAENALRVPCTFTQVVNPALVPTCVREELAEVERSGRLLTESFTCTHQHHHPQEKRHVRFYRPPPPVFRSLFFSRTNEGATYEATRQGRCLPRHVMAENRTTDPQHVQPPLRSIRCKVDSKGKISSPTTTFPCSDSPAAASENEPPQLWLGHSSASRVATAEKTEEQGREEEEAPEDYVPEVIHAAPPTQHRVHIPPGTGYFPESDESYGAIKCKEGWLLWKEAHTKWANKAQPAILIRKGLAMKSGVLYVGLFSEYA